MSKGQEELESIQDSGAPALTAYLADSVAAQLRGGEEAKLAAMRNLARTISRNLAAADLFGRRRLLKDLADDGSAQFALFDVSFLPKIPFQEAIESVLARTPVIARGWRRVQEAYNRGGFALAMSASESVTKHVRSVISKAASQGVSSQVATNEIAEALGARKLDIAGARYVKSYADTVFRTTTTGAYAEGRRQQAFDPEVGQFIGGWRFDATNDRDTRPNHWAADGYMAPKDSPVWQELTPPLGYNCRCNLSVISKRKAARLGLDAMRFNALPPGAGRDPGFGPSGSQFSVY